MYQATSSIRPRIDVLCPIHHEPIVVIQPGIDGQPAQGKCVSCLTQGAITVNQLAEQYEQIMSGKVEKLEKLHEKSRKRLTFLKKQLHTIADQVKEQLDGLYVKVDNEIERLDQNVAVEKEKLRCIDISALTYSQLMETLQQLQNDKSETDYFKLTFNEDQIKEATISSYIQCLTFFLNKSQQLQESWPAQGEFKLINQRDSFQNCNTIATNKELTTLINGLNNQIQVWSIGHDGTLTHQENLEEHQHPVTCLTFCKSDLFASGAQDYLVKIWSLNEQKWSCIQTIDYHMESINDLKFSSDGDFLFTASNDATVRLCKIMNNYAEYEETFSGTFSPIDFLSLSPNNKQLLACDREKNLILWQRDNVKNEWVLKTELIKFEEKTLFTKATFIDDQEILALNEASVLQRFVQNAEGEYMNASNLPLDTFDDFAQGFPLTYNSSIKLALCRNGDQQINVLNKQESGFGILQKIHGNFSAGIFSSDGKAIILIEKHYGVVQILKMEQ